MLHFIGRTTAVIGSALRAYIDKAIINEAIGDGTASLVKRSGVGLRPIQSGRLQQYMVASLLVFLLISGLLYYFLVLA